MGLFGCLWSNKLLILFVAATAAFAVATIVLAVEKSNLEDDLDTCEAEKTEAPPETTVPTTTVRTTTKQPENMDNYRLPRTVIPESYDLTLYPDLKTELFSGKVIATVDVSEDGTEIKIHSNGLKVDRADINGKEATVEFLDEKYELLSLSLPDGGKIGKGKRVVTIEYNGNMANRIVGLYTSRYKNEDGNERAIATTKFEPTYARQAFPCFDEPDMKAKYTVHIQVPKGNGYIALSNMPESGRVEGDNHVMVSFKESVRMSTYLSCFIVCDFTSLPPVKVKPIKGEPFDLTVYATPAQKGKTQFALDVAEAVIKYFVGYFDIEYPLPKLDLIAIPDFVSGAMEHWGLVTFRETALLFDEKTSSSANRQRVATVVAHELAHSWFGNLVTMKWWNDLWLNEGFASYIQYKGVHAYDNKWQMLDQLLIDHLHSVLSFDATPASHPIVQTVLTPDQITEIFDIISYNKGAAILRMLETAVTEEVFRKGVTAYLNKYAWGNAVTQDLLDQLQRKVTDPSLDITDFMNTWTVQKGYPILTVKEEGDEYVLTQKRFLKDYSSVEEMPSPYQYKWTIPVTYFSDKDTEYKLLWFKHTDEKLTIKKPTGATWVKFNHDQVGYYRVNYSPDSWKLLIKNIDQITSTSDRTHLLEESFSIAESGDLAYEIPLGLTEYLQREFNYIPWSVASTKLENLRKYLADSPVYSQYLAYIIKILEPAYKELSWDESAQDAHLRRRARVTILGLACSVGYSPCLEEASNRFTKWLADPENSPVSQDFRSIVYKYGMVNGGNKEWEHLLELYKSEIDANEKLNMLRGLAAVKEPWLLKRLIEIGKIVGENQVIRGQDYFTMLQYVAANSVGAPIVWDHVREDWEYLVKRFTLNDRYLGKLIPSITSDFVTTTKLDEMNAFFKKYPEAGAGQAARGEALQNVNNNIKWIEKNRKAVEEWIKLSMNPVAASS